MATIKINCACGCSINKNYFKSHIYSKKHIEFILDDKNIINYDTVCKEEKYKEIDEKMEKLLEKVDKKEISEGDYVKECNKLKKDYDNNKKSLINFNSDERKGIYKIMKEINYKGFKPFVSQCSNYYYYNYYITEDDKMLIIKIDYLYNLISQILR